jgi:hypothetical protein
LGLLNSEHSALFIPKHSFPLDPLGFGVADKPTIHGLTESHAVAVSGVGLPVFSEPTQGWLWHLADGRAFPFANWTSGVGGLRFLVDFGELGFGCHILKRSPSEKMAG